MIVLLWLLAVAVVLVSSTLWLSWTASRLDRLHHLVETAWAALDAQLLRRCAVALEVASAGLLDPAASVLLTDAAHQARAAEAGGRERAESALSAALRAVLGERGQLSTDPRAAALLSEMDGAIRRVLMARTFYNDAVTAVRRLRQTRVVRWFGLAGQAVLPAYFDIDDAPPTDQLAGHTALG